MARNRCYFLAGECIKAAEDIEAEDDAGALRRAEELIPKSLFLAVEVWREERLVGRHTIAPDIQIIPGGRTT